MPSPVVKLNIGGVTYDTAAETLASRPGYLRDVVQGVKGAGQDEEGRVFLDRDGKLFRYVLEFLRYGALHPPSDFNDWSALRSEFLFYFGSAFEDFYVLQDAEGLPSPAPTPPTLPRTPSPSPPSMSPHVRMWGAAPPSPSSPATPAVEDSSPLVPAHPASLRLAAQRNMKASEEAAVDGLLACVRRQVLEYSKLGEGYLGVTSPAADSVPLQSCRWAVWTGNWASLRSFAVIESLLEDGFDVLVPGQVSIASLGRSFSCKARQPAVPADPLKSVKGGFVVAWVRSAVRLTHDATGSLTPRFCSADLRNYVFGQATGSVASFLLARTDSPARRFQRAAAASTPRRSPKPASLQSSRGASMI